MSIAARKPVLPVMVVCSVLVGWLMWSAVPALAAAPETPEVSVELPVPATTATVHGVLNPGVEGAPGTDELGTYEFLYKQGKAGCEGEGRAPASPGISLGGGKEAVTEVLQGLSPGTEYMVCLLARTGVKGETSVSMPVAFTTAIPPQAPVTSSPASVVTATSATLGGVLNPGGKGEAGSYEFLYRQSPSECEGEGSSGGSMLGTQNQVVSAEVSGLKPNKPYTFCLLARNEAGETALGSPVMFTTQSSKPTTSGEAFSKVSAKSATVSAQVETGGLETTFTVQYGTTSAYGSETAGVIVPASATTASTELTGLVPDTEYHFRVLVANTDGSNQGVVDTVFDTLPAATSGLPDDRTYEMVTPPGNGNSDVESPRDSELNTVEEGWIISTLSPFEVAPDGSKITYSVLALTGANGVAGKGDQYLAERSPTGEWSQSSIQPNAYSYTEYQGFSRDLSIGIIESGEGAEPEVLPPLSLNAPAEGYKILYERMTSGSGYRPLITNAIKLNRSSQSSEEGGFGANMVLTGQEAVTPAFAGGSADFKDLLFEANDALLAGEGVLEKELEDDVKGEISKGTQANYLYDESDGRLSLVDVSPEGKVVSDATFGARPFIEAQVNKSRERNILYHNPPDFSHVISGDGRFVYWTDVSSGLVYVREDGSSTVQVSAGAARYWTASADGRYALYTEGEGMASELYRFDSEPENGQPQREVLTGANAGVLGVLGASEDANTVYFVAKGVLSGVNGDGMAPVAGEPNLYAISHGGAPVFIATLSQEDGNQVQSFNFTTEATFGDWQPGFGQRTARVTADGESVVFMSNQSLSVTGYPHGYPTNGSDEVYVYNAGSRLLSCVSCGSTGEASSGGFLPIDWHDTYLPQWISEDGNRVFFDSSAPLVAQDTNGRQDVYEWEREGHGSCTHGYGSTGGCVFLLSGGSSEANSWFVGASANGSDAFIVTRAKLVPEDENDAFDLYDARVDGVKSVAPPVCTGTGCQGLPAPPPLFATPSSATFNGVGNFTTPVAEHAKPKTKVKALTRAQKLARALKACERQKKHKKRVSCQAGARRLYGSARKSGRSLGGVQRRKHA